VGVWHRGPTNAIAFATESSNRAFSGLATLENSFGDALWTDLQSLTRNQRAYLPKSIRAVANEQGVTADDHDLLGERLSDDQAVEWVAVMPRKVHLKIGVFHDKRQRRGLQIGDRLIHPGALPLREFQFANPDFDTNLLDGRGADEYFVLQV
jgi:hypothetical protein